MENFTLPDFDKEAFLTHVIHPAAYSDADLVLIDQGYAHARMLMAVHAAKLHLLAQAGQS